MPFASPPKADATTMRWWIRAVPNQAPCTNELVTLMILPTTNVCSVCNVRKRALDAEFRRPQSLQVTHQASSGSRRLQRRSRTFHIDQDRPRRGPQAVEISRVVEQQTDRHRGLGPQDHLHLGGWGLILLIEEFRARFGTPSSFGRLLRDGPRQRGSGCGWWRLVPTICR